MNLFKRFLKLFGFQDGGIVPVYKTMPLHQPISCFHCGKQLGFSEMGKGKVIVCTECNQEFEQIAERMKADRIEYKKRLLENINGIASTGPSRKDVLINLENLQNP